MMYKQRTLLILLTVFFSAVAHAQFGDMWGTRWNNPVSSFIGSSLYWKNMTRTPPGEKSLRKAPAGTVHFEPLARYLTTASLARAFSDEAGQQQELKSAFEQFLDLFDHQIATGDDRRNLASAAAFFMVSHYGVATRREVGDRELNALRDALQLNLKLNKTFQGYSHRQRQELYESLVVFALLARYGFQDGEEKGDPEQMNRFRDFARECLKAVLGVSPEQMVFTASGLEFR